MAKYSDFLPYVLPYVTGCSVPLAEQYVRDICIDFCVHTLLVQETLDPISVRQGVASYGLFPSIGTKVHLVMNAWYEANKLAVFNGDSPANHPELYNKGFKGADATQGTPRALIMQGENILLDTPPAADSPKALTVQVALKPSRNSTTVADVLFEDYAFEIGQGALARLVMLPGQAFTNPSLSAPYYAVYASARSKARVRSSNSSGRSTTRIHPVRF